MGARPQLTRHQLRRSAPAEDFAETFHGLSPACPGDYQPATTRCRSEGSGCLFAISGEPLKRGRRRWGNFRTASSDNFAPAASIPVGGSRANAAASENVEALPVNGPAGGIHDRMPNVGRCLRSTAKKRPATRAQIDILRPFRGCNLIHLSASARTTSRAVRRSR